MNTNLFSLSGLLLSVICFILVCFTLRAARTRIHYIWAFFNLSVALWGFSSFFLSKGFSHSFVLFWLRVAHAGVIFIAVFFFHFVYLLCKLSYRNLLIFCYAQGIFFFLLNTTDYFVNPAQVTLIFNEFYFDRAKGMVIPLFFILWCFFIILGHIYLFLNYRQSTGFRKNQLLYLFVGTGVGFLGGITNFFPTFGVPFYPIGNFTIPLYCIIVTYAILKYQLLDIRVAITRTGLFLFVYAIVLGIPFGVTSLSGIKWE
ncbi:MAG: hypothetical protein N2606_01850 [Candidatus Omnitrophica bacterium]|nr:hypothetical protein [Candidatus Omnitrophota bacterium]